jgi:hypothetical protein
LPSLPYFVFVSRAGERPKVGVWPIALGSPLPDIPIPLDAGDPDAWLKLQRALDTLHADMRYDLSVDYTQPPPGPMAAEDLAWVEERLRAAGRRG